MTYTFCFYYPGIKSWLEVVLMRMQEFGVYDTDDHAVLNELNEFLQEIFISPCPFDDVEAQWQQFPDDFVTYETFKFFQFIKSSNLPLTDVDYRVESSTGLIKGYVLPPPH